MAMYLTYLILTLIPIVAIFVLIVLVLFFGICCRCCNSCRYCKKIPESLVKFMLKRLLQIPYAGKEETLKVEVIMWVQDNRSFFVMLLFTLGFVACALVTAWEVFLLEETYACDPNTPGLDCFPRTKEALHMPPLNCSEYITNGSTTSIVCYRFIYRFGEAAATMGGLFTLATIILTSVGVMMYWLLGSCTKDSSLEIRGVSLITWRRIGIVIIQILAFLLFILLLVVTIILPGINGVLTLTTTVAHCSEYVFLAVGTLMLLFVIPWNTFVDGKSNPNESETTPINQDPVATQERQRPDPKAAWPVISLTKRYQNYEVSDTENK